MSSRQDECDVLELIIISPGPLVLDRMLLALTPRTGSWVVQGPDRAVLQSGSAYVSLNCAASLSKEWEDQELRSIHASIPQPRFLLVEANNRELMERVIGGLAEAIPGALVDNDHGLRGSLASFAATMEGSPSWNWQEAAELP